MTNATMRNAVSNWELVPFPECLQPLGFARPRKVLARDYKKRGSVPVVDQGQRFIAGYTDDEDAVIDQGLPMVVFGDHTRVFKYVDFPFALGADGTQLLKPAPEFDPHFFYFACLHLRLPSRGYNRHFTLLKEKSLPRPDRAIQQRIAAALLKFQRAIAVEDLLTETTRELKRAVSLRLFSGGLREEAVRETEIGTLPASWEVLPLGRHVLRAQYGLSVRGESSGRYPILRMNCQVDGRVEFRELQFVDLEPNMFESFRLEDGDLLFNRTNSPELVGRTAVFHSEREAVFASYLIRVSVDRREFDPDFLNQYLNHEPVQVELKKLASRGVSQANISASKLKDFSVPKPSLDEQREIAVVFKALDERVQLAERRRQVLAELFDVMLEKLMGGELRVDNLEFDGSDIVAA